MKSINKPSHAAHGVLGMVVGLWLGGCAVTAQQPDQQSLTQSDEITADGSNPAISPQINAAPGDVNPGVTPTQTLPSATAPQALDKVESTNLNQPVPDADWPQALSIKHKGKTGSLDNSELSEISGLSASNSYPGVLYAINDSGNSPTLYALDETGQLRHQWTVNAKNRDWEDLAQIQLNGANYLAIGDTGDNLRTQQQSTLYLLAEPTIPSTIDTLEPTFTVTFNFDDGPRNVEAIAAYGNSFYLLSKEPVSALGRTPNGVYRLDIPEDLSAISTSVLTARRVGTMPLRSLGLEARLAAAVAGVDLSHPTAMAFDASSETAYILTYREVLSVRKQSNQSWANAFSLPAKRVTQHALAQAEALSVSPGRAIWFTSEKVGAPLWAIPLTPPL